MPLFKKEIHNAFYSRGKISYGPTNNELSNLQFRRSIYASQDIKKNEKFTKDNIKIIRPSYGLKQNIIVLLLVKKQRQKSNMLIQLS